MKNKKWIRALAIVLVLACLIGTVAAAGSAYLDLNGDGITNIWDAQKALFDESYSAEQKDSYLGWIKDQILGTADTQETEGDVHLIDSVADLYAMAENPSGSYKLTQDIDLQGLEWVPVVMFNGTFDGNNKTIRNFTITQAVPSRGSSTATEYNIGFFGDCAEGAMIQDLHLEDFRIDASDTNAQFVGCVIATNRGQVNNCTVDGILVDTREKVTISGAEKMIYRGFITGRNATKKVTVDGVETTVAVGSVTLGSFTTNEGNGTQVSVAAKMALELPEGTAPHSRGSWFVGYGDHTANGTEVWRDSSNSTELMAQELQERRQTVVDYMRAMATSVYWTPNEGETMTWYIYKTKADGSLNYNTNTWTSGTYYRGIPYNHGSGSLERFLSVMEESGTDGILTPVESLSENAYYYTHDGVTLKLKEYAGTPSVGTTVAVSDITGIKELYIPTDMDLASLSTSGTYSSGFSRYIGNDCSSAVSQAWRRVSAVSGEGFGYITSTTTMSPATYSATSSNMASYGIQTFNGLVLDFSTSNLNKYASSTATTGTGKRGAYTDALFASNNALFWEAFAQASKGDAMVGNNNSGGHSRLIAYDPVIIRDASGNIQAKTSYIITIEQGRGSSGKTDGISWRSNWTVDFEYTLDQLTNHADPSYTNIGSKTCYVPITMTALNVVDTPAAVPTVSMDANGNVTSNFSILSTTVGGEEIYNGISYQISGDYRGRLNTVALENAHAGFAYGTTEQVDVQLSNGNTYTLRWNGSSYVAG